MFASSGNGTATASGRLLQPFVLRRGGQHGAASGFSDDGGLTWALGEPIGPDCDETKLPGPCRQFRCCCTRAPPRRRAAASADGAGLRRPEPDAALVDPERRNGGLALLAAGVAGPLVVATEGLDSRPSGAAWWRGFRAGGGTTWDAPVVIDAGAAAYSVAVPLPDGSLELAWSRANYDALLFAEITRPSWGWTARPPWCPTEGDPGAAAAEVAGP